MIANKEFAVLEKEILAYYDKESREKHFYLNYIDSNCEVHSLSFSHGRQIDLLLLNETDTESLKIQLLSTKISIDVTFTKQNNFYKFFGRYDKDFDFNVKKNNINVIGIMIGDLIRIYHKNNPNKTNNKLFDKFVTKALNQEIMSDYSNKNVLGIFNNNSISLWDTFIDKNVPIVMNFFSKIIYFDNFDTYSLLTRTFNNKTGGYNLSIKVESVDKLLNQVACADMINKLFRYYYYKENPLLHLKDEDNIYVFEQPKSIPDVLKEIYHLKKIEEYMLYYHRLMKPNNHELQQLNDIYLPQTIISIKNIEDEFPFFALKNVYVMEWHETLINDDFHMVKNLYRNYLLLVKNSKNKYKTTQSEKVMPVNSRHHRRNSWNLESYIKSTSQRRRVSIFNAEIDDFYEDDYVTEDFDE